MCSKNMRLGFSEYNGPEQSDTTFLQNSFVAFTAFVGLLNLKHLFTLILGGIVIDVVITSLFSYRESLYDIK